MKTLHQYLWELDDEKLFDFFCVKYESRMLSDMEYYNYIEDMTVRELRQKYKEMFFSYLERLRQTRPKKNTGKIFIFHRVWSSPLLFDVKLISLEELALYDLSAGQDLSYPDLSEALGAYIGNMAIASSSVYDGIARILFKLSEIGYSQEEIDESKKAYDEYFTPDRSEEHFDDSDEEYAFEGNEYSKDTEKQVDEETLLRRTLLDAEKQIDKLFMREAYEKNLEILETEAADSYE